MSEDYSRLLARGGRILGLAALAAARGRRAESGRWHVLSADTAAAADQVLSALEDLAGSPRFSAAVAAAMSEQPATAPPSWSEPVLSGEVPLEAAGRRISRGDIGAALGRGDDGGDPRTRALAALGLALCRSPDAVRAVGARLGGDDSEMLERTSRLAQARSAPGDPSRIRRELRAAIERLSAEREEQGS
ncbi:MAG: hypothetical protein R6V85_20690 [Polyangia bacterium]